MKLYFLLLNLTIFCQIQSAEVASDIIGTISLQNDPANNKIRGSCIVDMENGMSFGISKDGKIMGDITAMSKDVRSTYVCVLNNGVMKQRISIITNGKTKIFDIQITNDEVLLVPAVGKM